MTGTDAEKQLQTGLVAGVALDRASSKFDKLYSYIVPRCAQDEVKCGMRVVIPFGKGNRKQIGMIFSLCEKEYNPLKTKAISSVIDDGIVLSGEILDLVLWMKENTFCTYFDGIRTVLPTGLSMYLTEKYELADEFDESILTADESDFLSALKSAETKRDFALLLESNGNKVKEKMVCALTEKGAIVRINNAKRRVGDEIELMVRLTSDWEKNLLKSNLTPKQKKVIEMLEMTGSASVKEVCYNCGITSAVIKNLEKHFILERFEFEVSRAVTADAVATESLNDLIFSEEQQEVFNGLVKLMESNEPKCALLRGITGSGKTSVFIKLIERTLDDGKTAIMLVPEIALTPQMVGKFQRLFGNKVAIIHSNLSLGQRTDEYKRIKNGEARIVIGTRSAVFAPLQNIGIIVIDEEGEHTYKSEKSPRYHARDIAKQRCFKNKAFLLLASATPSLESYYHAKSGRYELFELLNRYKEAVLPDVYLVDMKAEAESGNRSNFSQVLIDELKTNLEKGEQSMLLLNRRGYHTYMNCVACGEVVECPNCNIPLTYHKANNSVICHYCGFTKEVPTVCGKCGSRFIHKSGTGTQRIEDEIAELFPDARILRMDADTTMSKSAFETKFAAFGNGEYDIMIGTQMIAKGLDFENVTLVGVLLIDKSLYAGDYLGYEKTFSLVTQVVGRTGRGSKKGRAYLQTYTPDHYVLQLAAQQDYTEFFEQEIAVRKALIFPPFCDIFLVGFSAVAENVCQRAAEYFLKLFGKRMDEEKTKPPFRVLGPTSCGRINGRYRYKLIIKCKNNKKFRDIMRSISDMADGSKEFALVSYYIDINGEII